MTDAPRDGSRGRPPYGGDDFARAVDGLSDPLSDPLPGPGPGGEPPAADGWYRPAAPYPDAPGYGHDGHRSYGPADPYARPAQGGPPTAQPPRGQPPHGYPGGGAGDDGQPRVPEQYAPQGYAPQGYAPHGYPAAYDGYRGGYPAGPGDAAGPGAPGASGAAERPGGGYPAPDDHRAPAARHGGGSGRCEAPGDVAADPEGATERERHRRSGLPGATAELPRVPDPAGAEAGGGVGGPDRPTGAGEEREQPSGGRAERRRAARRSGRRAPAGPAPSPPAGEGRRAPASRMEAKRAARAARTSPGVVASQVTGELFITMGVLMLLFVVYQLWYTNVLADEAAGRAAKHLQSQWADHKASSDAGEPSRFPEGTPFAMIYIPKLDVKAPIAEGVDKTTILDKGEVGHYSGDLETAMPWAKSGNFALAGHRNTHGEPFRYINKLVPGDKVVVETSGMYYTYQITSSLPQTPPSNISVIEPVPPGSGFTRPGRYITLTTCTPEFTSEFRMIVWGKLVAEQPRTEGTPAALLGG